MTLDDLEKICAEATPAPWGILPGCGDNEDEGCMEVGAVGPSHRFLIGDCWEYAPDPQPRRILPEGEANRRAHADQAFIAAARTMMPKLIAVAKAARNLVDAPIDDLGDLIYDQTYNLLMDALAALEQS